MHNNPQLLTIITVLLWSAGALVGKLISSNPVFLIVCISQLSCALFILLIKYFKNKLSISKKVINFKAIVIGFVGHAGYWAFFLFCFRSTDNASVPSILNYTWPAFTVIFSEYIFNYKKNTLLSRFFQFSGVTFGLLGVAILSTKGDFENLKGINYITASLGIASGMSYGIFSAYSSKIDLRDQLDFLLIASLSSVFFLAPFAYSELSIIKEISFDDVILAAWIGIIMDGLGSMLWIRANRIAAERNIDISKAASLIYLLPVLSLILVTLFFKENFYTEPYFIIASVLITTSVVICNLTR